MTTICIPSYVTNLAGDTYRRDPAHVSPPVASGCLSYAFSGEAHLLRLIEEFVDQNHGVGAIDIADRFGLRYRYAFKLVDDLVAQGRVGYQE